MNVLGVEFRTTLAVLSLREGPHRPRLVGDGRGSVIPAAVGLGDAWGSEAVSQPEHSWDGLSPLVQTDLFWRGVRERMTRFLGGLSSAAHDYRLVIATSIANNVAQSARASGFDLADVIVPPQAVMARWLAESFAGPESERVVAVVTIGDVSAEAAAFVVRTGGTPSIVHAAFAEPLLGVGAGYWSRRLVEEVKGHVAEESVGESRFTFWRSAMEMGDRLRRAGSQRAVSWIGPLVDELVTPVTLSASDFANWREVETFTKWMPGAVRDALRGLDVSRVDTLLVSGLGASWPLADAAWEGFPAPIVSGDPAADIAIGATWWPLIRGVAGPNLRSLGIRDDVPRVVRDSTAPRPGIAPRLAHDPRDRLTAARSPLPLDAPHRSSPPAQPSPGIDPNEFSRLLDDQLKNSSTDNS